MNGDFDFTAAARSADRLEEVAAQIRLSAGKLLNEGMTAVHAAWGGASGDTFIKQCREVEELIQKRAAALQRTAAEIRHTAEQQLRASQ